MFPNYDTSEKTLFFQQVLQNDVSSAVFIKEITITTQNDNFNLSIFCYVRLKYATSDELSKIQHMAEQSDFFIPWANDVIKI